MPQNLVEVGLAGALPGTAEIFDLFDASAAADPHAQGQADTIGGGAQSVAMAGQSAAMAQENAHTMMELQGQVAMGAAQNMHTIQELQGTLQAQQADIMHSLQQSALPIDQAFGVEYGHMDYGLE